MAENGRSSNWRKMRLAAGLSIRDLAIRADVNRGSISRIERGWPATPDEAAKLLAVLSGPETI